MDGKSKRIMPRDIVVEEIAPAITIKTVKIQSLVDAKVTYSGRVSGEQYVWTGAGAIVNVDERDVSDLLEKQSRKKSCCGQGPKKIFQVAL